MNINITAAGILSFEDDEPMGLKTFGDRKELERRRAERIAASPEEASANNAMLLEGINGLAPAAEKVASARETAENQVTLKYALSCEKTALLF